MSKGSTANKGTLTPSSGSSAPVLKLERVGDRVSASVSLDGGVTFGSPNNMDISDLPNQVYVGLAVSSGNNATATAAFSDILINGSVVGF